MSILPTYTASIEWGGDGITYNPTPPDPAKKLRDDLLRALGREASNSARINTGAWRDEAEDNLHIGLDLVHSPAGRDIVKHAVDAAEATHCLLMNHESRLADAERRNTLLHDWAASLGCPPGVFTFEWLQQEVAERQARAVDLAQQLDRTQEECARRGDALRRAERERDTALASLTESNRVAATAVQQLDEARKIRDEVQEVTLTAQRERDEALRAAPQLPDVGPVTRRSDGEFSEWLFEDGLHYEDSDLKLDSPNGRAVHIAKLIAIHQRLLADEAAENTTPDTSRVSFGQRHEGTGMVLLQHADLGDTTWGGEYLFDTAEYHRGMAISSDAADRRAAHADLAEVREALNTAEAAGVDVADNWTMFAATCDDYGPLNGDDRTQSADARARRFLAREVQALVDQGLRGDDLNAQVPYPVRDHRVQEADIGSDDEDPRVEAVRQYVGTLERLNSLSPEILRYARMIARDLRNKLDMEPQPDLDRACREGGA